MALPLNLALPYQTADIERDHLLSTSHVADWTSRNGHRNIHCLYNLTVVAMDFKVGSKQ